MRWIIQRNELVYGKMRWKVGKSSGSLILGGRNDIRVEKELCQFGIRK